MRLFFLAMILLLELAVPALTAAQDGAKPRYGGTYRRPLANNPSNLDPALISDIYGFAVAQQMFDGLVQYDGTLTIVPAIAESWKGSRDGLSWTFNLRKGVRFHNGREVVAEDVVYSFTRILDPRTSSKAAEVFLKVKGAREFTQGRSKGVEGLRAVDRYTVQIDLVEASAPFVASLAMGYIKIVPREAVEALGAGFGLSPVGTGPFKFLRWKQDEEIVLEANNDYYAGRPFLDRLEYRVYPGAPMDKIFADFEGGALDDSFVPGGAFEKLRQGDRYQFVQRPVLGIRFLGFNTTQPPLSIPLVRQAIVHAVDREALVRDIHFNRYRVAAGFLPPGTYGYNPQFRPLPFDPDRARSLLVKAGYPGGKGLPPIQLWSSVKPPHIEKEHAAIRKSLADVGIQLELHYHTDWPSFNKQVYEGKYPLFRYSWTADVPEPDNFLYRLFHSQSRNNLTRYQNPRVDRILDQARAELEYLKRIELHRQAERLIMEDAPVIPLNYLSYERLFQPYVQSIEVSALGDPYIPMRKIWLAK